MKKGKCYSMVNQGQRLKSDVYQTPYSMTGALLDVVGIWKGCSILEPCSGQGAIIKVLRDRGYTKVTEGCIEKGFDFFTIKDRYYAVITNPPYSRFQEFVERSFVVARNLIAFLLPISYLQGKKRYDRLYAENSNNGFGLASVNVFVRMPMLSGKIREDGKYSTGMQTYAWYIWNKHCAGGSPIIRWIDNSKYVLKKGRR